MKMNIKKNGDGYVSGCTIAFGSKEMHTLHLVNSEGKLKEIKSATSEDENTLIIKFKK